MPLLPSENSSGYDRKIFLISCEYGIWGMNRKKLGSLWFVGGCSASLLLSLICMSACRHGASEASEEAAPFFGKRFKQAFHAGISVGGLAEVQVDTTALTYSYKVAEGKLAGKTHSGTLRSLERVGGDLYATEDGRGLLTIKDELVFGSMDKRFYAKHFYAGVPALQGSLASEDVEGVYNFLYFSPGSASSAGVNYGSIQLAKDPISQATTFRLARRKQVTKATDSEVHTGTYKDLGTGIVELWDGGEKIANVLLRQRKNGQTFAVIDFSQGISEAGLGFAQKQQAAPVVADLSGFYNVLSPGATGSGSFHIVGDVWTLYTALTFKMTQNLPWNGLMTGKFQSDEGEIFLSAIYSAESRTIYGLIEPNGSTTDEFPRVFIATRK